MVSCLQPCTAGFWGTSCGEASKVRLPAAALPVRHCRGCE
jgi:hypothetical protein